jgi:hypothetical protein
MELGLMALTFDKAVRRKPVEVAADAFYGKWRMKRFSMRKAFLEV